MNEWSSSTCMNMFTIYVAGLSAGLTLEILLIGVLFITALLIYRLGSRSGKSAEFSGRTRRNQNHTVGWHTSQAAHLVALFNRSPRGLRHGVESAFAASPVINNPFKP